MLDGRRRGSRFDAYHRAAMTSRKWTKRQLSRWMEDGEAPVTGRRQPIDPEAEKLAAQVRAGGTLKIDAEGNPYVES